MCGDLSAPPSSGRIVRRAPRQDPCRGIRRQSSFQYPATVKAILKERPSEGREWKKGLSIEDCPAPVIKKSSEAKIRIVAGAICGTDGAIYDSRDSLRREMLKAGKPKIVLGHEFCGRLADAGTEAREIIARLVIRHGEGDTIVGKFIA